MKRLSLLLLVFVLAYVAHAQGQQRFDPAKFDAEQQQFITRSACLTAMDYRDEIDMVYLWAKEQPLQ